MNKIINVTLADTAWAEVPLVNKPVAIAIQARTAVDVLVDYVSGVHPTYWTVKAGTVKSMSWQTYQNDRIFIKCLTPGTVVEVEMATEP